MRRTAGFTLIELLLVLILIGIGTSLAIVSVNQLVERSEERRWSDRVQQELHRLRNKAILGRRPIQATIDFERGTLASDATATLTLPMRFHFSEAIASSALPSNPFRLIFFPDGTMDTARFFLTMPSGQRQEFRLERISGRIERGQVPSSEAMPATE